MAEYKRKKVKKSFKHKKGHTNSDYDIVMTNKHKNNIGIVPEEKIKVVKGNKFKRKQRIKLCVYALSFIVLICIIFSAILPGSLYENVINLVSKAGHGTYPTSVSGGAVICAVSNDSYYYVLSDTSITAYSNNGRIIFDELHGFSNPIISVSSTRALIYDQGGNTVYIYNLNGKIHTIETKKEIITASISQNGDFAIATHSDSYASVVTVYDNRFNEAYIWNSAKDIVNNVLVNNKGNKLAVSTFNVVSGQYVSKLLILDFDSADPLYTLDLGNQLALTIDNTGKGISIICNNVYKFLHWSKFTTSNIEFSGEINLFRNSKSGVLLAVNRANDRSDNNIVLVSKKGNKLSEFKINNFITDIQYNKGRIYSVCDVSVAIYDKNGNQLKNDICSYGTQKIVVIAPNSIATISDNEIQKSNIEEGE